jgi:hypothetical protein
MVPGMKQMTSMVIELLCEMPAASVVVMETVSSTLLETEVVW